MDKALFQERVKRLKEADQVIKLLDPAIRAAAFDLLQPYITGSKQDSPKPPKENRDLSAADTNMMSTLLAKFDHKKPSDNVMLIAAYHFSQFGVAPLSFQEVRTIAEGSGLTIPGRLEMTFSSAARSGRKLFSSAGRGQVKPTVQGEQFLKETYGISKGTLPKPNSDKK
jgi:hypothetical protein